MNHDYYTGISGRDTSLILLTREESLGSSPQSIMKMGESLPVQNLRADDTHQTIGRI